MNWSAYEIFSVLSGAALIGCAFLPSDKPSSRLWAVIGGIAFIGYGIFVASRETGTYVFPVWIFFIPFLVVIYMIATVVARSSGRGREDLSDSGPAGDAGRAADDRSADW